MTSRGRPLSLGMSTNRRTDRNCRAGRRRTAGWWRTYGSTRASHASGRQHDEGCPTRGHRLTVLSARSGVEHATARRVRTVVRALFASTGLVLVLDAISARVYAGGSDRATAILEGQAVGSGNVLLHGWILTHDSFWTIDAFFYALAVRIGGLRPGLLNLEPALAVAIAVVVGAFVASRGHRGGAAIAGATRSEEYTSELQSLR